MGSGTSFLSFTRTKGRIGTETQRCDPLVVQNDEPLDSWWNSAPQSPWPPTSIHGLHKHGELSGARQTPSRAPEPRRHNQQRTPGVPKTSWEPGLPRHSEGVSRTTTRETSGPQSNETAQSSAAAGTEGKPARRQALEAILKALLPANLPRSPHRRPTTSSTQISMSHRRVLCEVFGNLKGS